MSAKIKKICLERDNGLVTYDRMKSALKRLRRGSYSERVFSSVSRYLRSRDYTLDYRELFSVLEMVSGSDGFSYRELCSVPDHIVRCIYTDILSLDPDLRENALNTLRTVDIVNVEKLFEKASGAEKFLLSLGPELFSGCDRNTKNSIRRRVAEYARAHGIDERSAASMIRTDAGTEAPPALKAMYYLFMALLTVIGFLTSVFIFNVGIGVSLLLLVPLSQTAKDLSDRAFGALCRADSLPKLKLDGIPEEGRTLVVITAVLTGGKSDGKRFDDIEKYFLSNRDDRVTFGILADLKESDAAGAPGDERIVDYASGRVSSLNQKYGRHFALFIRSRTYDPGEGKFMGRERKRGAVRDLVRLIKRRTNDFSVVDTDRMTLHKTKYIITLDSDTSLYPGAVFDLVGAALHPENKAVIRDGKVVSGYGVMQPRMDTTLESASSTLFSSMLCGSGGIDVYSGASFDVYQNVFGEGVFCGKGLIDVDAYFEVLDDFFPDGLVLSHDLLEGEKLRCAALTDVVLCDSLPSNPISYFKRSHRWARGDIQALAFAGKRFAGPEGERRETGFSALSKYKLFDNLRRLLVPVCSVAAVLISAPYSGRQAYGAVLGALSFIIARLILSLPALVRNLPRRFVSYVSASAGKIISNCAYDTASLFYSAVVNIDAAARSLFRMFVSHKKLLEWTVQETNDLLSPASLPYYFFRMSPGLAVGLMLFIFAPGSLHKILGLFWVAMPFASYLLSKKQPERKTLSDKDKKLFTAYACRHWRFLCDYVTAGDNFLPPDNVQYIGREKTAHRTSPTNVGLYLLSVVAARDLGFISTDYAIGLLSRTLDTVEAMRKWKGNLYNWYDTQTLEVIGGDFVSSVDSGNFAACLISAKEGIKDRSSENCAALDLAVRMEKLIAETDIGAFYDPDRDLISVGFDGKNGKLLSNCYDVYMTECRTASYVGIGLGQLPRSHWAALARLLVSRDGYMGMLSWNGTMFEYFMPSLFLPVYRNSLEYESLRFAVRMQYENRYSGVWGKSECGYPEIDGDGNYKYKAVGVSCIGMERGLEEMKVISPYSSFLCSCVTPDAAVSNLSRLKKLGAYGRYGFYESVDLSRPGDPRFTQSYMSHHVGMSIVAAQNAVLCGIAQKRFMRDVRMGCLSDLLKEKIPLDPRMAKTRRIFPGIVRPSGLNAERFSEV